MRKLIAIASLISILFACSTGVKENSTLTIFHAGSLSMPIKAIADSFMRENPNVQFKLEAAGSVECARKITELSRSADIMASADYKIIDQLLIPKHASFNILFAGNEMALVYTKKSRFADEISKDNWYEILQNPSVHFGRSDPNADPCGYRTLLTMQLAEKYYGEVGLARNLRGKDTRFIRPKEVDLIALLETGAIDYIFLYRSVAVQHRLSYLSLPKEINLGDPTYSEQYKQVSVTIRGSAPTDSIVIVGEPMVYGITIPNSSTNKQLAQKFLKFFTSKEKGLKVLETMGMPLIWPPIVNGTREDLDNNQ